MLPLECGRDLTSKAISSLLQAHATHIHKGILDVGVNVDPWQQMVTACYVTKATDTHGKDGCQLTEKGLDAIRCGTSNTVRRPLFQVRNHVAIENLTSLELALTLVDQCWEWRYFPENDCRP